MSLLLLVPRTELAALDRLGVDAVFCTLKIRARTAVVDLFEIQ